MQPPIADELALVASEVDPTGFQRPSKTVRRVFEGPSKTLETPSQILGEKGVGSSRSTGETSSGGSVRRTYARTRTRVKPATMADLAGTAHTPRAHRLVEDYARGCAQRPPTSVLTALAVEVDKLIAEDWPDDRLRAAITEWGAKGLHPKTFASVAHETANRLPRQRGTTASAMPAGMVPGTSDETIVRLLAGIGREAATVVELPGGFS
jgi:hypothetical protein